jgi:hypothetical protein
MLDLMALQAKHYSPNDIARADHRLSTQDYIGPSKHGHRPRDFAVRPLLRASRTIATDQAEKKYAQTSPASSRVLDGRKVVPTPKSIMAVAATHEITDRTEIAHRLR